MDDSQFDALVRSLSAAHSRRGLSRVFGGLVLGGPLAGLFSRGDVAAKRKKRKKRKKDKDTHVGCTPDASNGSCVLACNAVDDCPVFCTCSLPSPEGPKHCVQPVNGCGVVPQPCGSTAECPLGQHCSQIGCGPGNSLVNRCRPLC